jgi:hypothetical protein
LYSAHAYAYSPYKQDVGMRAAWGIAAVTPSLHMASAPYLGPTYYSAKAITLANGGGAAVEITFADAGLYAAAPVVNSSVVCPPKIKPASCESFAVLSAPDCVWHPAEAQPPTTDYTTDQAMEHTTGSNTIVLKPSNWSAGLTIAGTRGENG